MVTLSVDDNPTVARAVADILANVDPTGTHLVASSAAEALATAADKPVQVAFLDVEMPDTDGLKLARLLRELRPETDIVFVTGYKEYAWRAFEVRASDYLLKPVTEEQIRRALVNLRHVSEGATEDNRLHIRCFGSFECLHKGTPVRFGRAKTKELLAYLVDRNGAICSTGELVTALWEKNTGSDASYANQLRVFISDLQTTLTRLGVGETLVRSRGQLGIDRNAVDCDYFAFLDGDPEARRSFRGEYMSQYSFGETTLAWLLRVSGNGIGQ